MSTDNKEALFLDKIDCNFPYQNQSVSLKLISEAESLSTNALFSIIEELCRIPDTEKKKGALFSISELLKLTASKIHHPLKEIIIPVANKMVRGENLTVNEVVSTMEIVRLYPKQYAALSILYFSCDDAEEKLEELWREIIIQWNDN